ncbi:MAG: cytochrome c [Thiocapsa sp.]|nr:cytochrome c [Thiocapsa sp.]MCG6897360.1 cytochrome c [Thiocapsa sp.]MCG6984485.1 cytochrome c [Thiocapsa sp.]
MKITRRLVGTALTALLAVATATARAEAGEGAESLYEANCLSCHGSEIYTREGRLISSMDGLERQVQRCETALGLRWFDDDIKDVANYLNDRFYHFGR